MVEQSARHLEALQGGNLPVVMVDRYFPRLKLPYVVSDNYRGGWKPRAILSSRGIGPLPAFKVWHGHRLIVRGYEAIGKDSKSTGSLWTMP